MLCDVEADLFFFLRDAQAHEGVDDLQPQGAGERGTGCELRRGLWWVFEQAPMFPNK